MKVFNIRLMFAANSSSTHSVVVVKDPSKYEDTDYEKDDFEFGWNNFILKSPEFKKEYLMMSVIQAMRELNYSNELINSVIIDVFDDHSELAIKKVKQYGYASYRGYVDHQSLLTIPKDVKTGHVSVAYIKDLYAFVQRDDTIIFGGSDNTCSEDLFGPSDEELKFTNAILMTEYIGYTVARKDGDYWTFLNTLNGTKMRFSFNDDAAAYTKANTPELVDVKITNYCQHNCEFCYQDSTCSGEHATLQFVTTTIHALHELGCLEIALGGGNVLEHPDLEKILEVCHDNNIIPNITIHASDISDLVIDKPNLLNSILKYCGGVAISPIMTTGRYHHKGFTGALCMLEQYISHYQRKNNCYRPVNISMQIIPELFKLEELKEILALVRYDRPVTLLGLKYSGRGECCKIVTPVDEIVKLFARCHDQFAIDTALYQSGKDAIDAVTSNTFICPTEGKFSCYIDAINLTINESSYSSKEPISLADCDCTLAKEIQKIFAKF